MKNKISCYAWAIVRTDFEIKKDIDKIEVDWNYLSHTLKIVKLCVYKYKEDAKIEAKKFAKGMCKVVKIKMTGAK